MQWMTVEIEIPGRVKKLFEKINKIEPNSCIAGGFLCDLYMNEPYKDIDIFIKERGGMKTFEKKEKIVELMEKEGFKEKEVYVTQEYHEEMVVSEYEENNMKVQLIYTPEGIQTIKRFDVRFREFFYFKGKVYATKEAIEDIKKKELVINFTRSPIRSMYRIFKFEKRYDFKINEGSLERFFALYNGYRVSKEQIQKYIEKAIKEKEYKQKYYHLATKYNTGYVLELPTKEEKWRKKQIMYLTDVHNDIKREQYEKLWNFTPKVEEEFLYSFKQNPFEEELEKKKAEVANEFKKLRTNMIFDFPTNFMKKWEKKIEEVTQKIEFGDKKKWKEKRKWFQNALYKFDIDGIEKKNDKGSDKTFTSYGAYMNYGNYIDYLVPLVDRKIPSLSYNDIKRKKFKKDIKIKLSDKLEYYGDPKVFTIEKLIKGCLIQVNIENYGMMIVDLEKKLVVESKVPEIIKNLLTELILEKVV